MKNHYSAFDALMEEARQVQALVLQQADQLMAVPAHKTIYSTPSLLLGLHTPTLLLGIHYSGAFKKGRKLRSPGDRTDYLSYDYDADGNLLRITHRGESPPYTHCFFRKDRREWAVPVYQSKTSGQFYHYPYYTFLTEYDRNGRIRYFGMVRGTSLRLEVYRYDIGGPSEALCDYWHYIPELIGSTKAAPLSEAGSPAELWRFQLDLSDPRHIRGVLLESYTQDYSEPRSVADDKPIPMRTFRAFPDRQFPPPDLYVHTD
ncbi:MAG: hypothetical protein IJ960_05375 [Oscillospiraceae bacterium]|nr:hypothetical protein [Oscillospiraceae bacterium]